MTLSASYEASMTLICPEYHEVEKFRLRVVTIIYLKDISTLLFSTGTLSFDCTLCIVVYMFPIRTKLGVWISSCLSNAHVLLYGVVGLL